MENTSTISSVSSVSQVPPSSSKASSLQFGLKAIRFFHRDVAIVCQNQNGPCPLIAVANVLLLQGKMHISTDRSRIGLEELTQLVAEVIVDGSTRKTGGASTVSESVTIDHHDPNNIQHHVEDVLHVLPKLAQGLDLNVYFTGVNKYEFTQEMSIFDTLSIPLLHGWLYESTPSSLKHDESKHHSNDGEVEFEHIMSTQSYNHLIFALVDYKALLDQLQLKYPGQELVTYLDLLTEDQRRLLINGAKIEHFLICTASQLTYKGLLKLYDFLNDRQLAVFFRNNHFSTMFFHQGQLFLLLTDLGFADQPSVVWELLESVDGKSEFYSSEFELSKNFTTTLLDSGAMLLGQVGEVVSNAASTVLGGTVALPPSSNKSQQASNKGAASGASPPPLPPKPEPIKQEVLIDTTESPMHTFAASNNNNNNNTGSAPTIIQPAAQPVVLPPPPPSAALSVQQRSSPPVEQSATDPSNVVIPVHVVMPAPAVAVSEVDADMLLAMQLQEEFNKESSHAASSPAISNAPNGSGMSQEELDRQTALMYHYQEMQASSGQQPRGSNGSQRSKGNCTMC